MLVTYQRTIVWSLHKSLPLENPLQNPKNPTPKEENCTNSKKPTFSRTNQLNEKVQQEFLHIVLSRRLGIPMTEPEHVITPSLTSLRMEVFGVRNTLSHKIHDLYHANMGRNNARLMVFFLNSRLNHSSSRLNCQHFQATSKCTITSSTSSSCSFMLPIPPFHRLKVLSQLPPTTYPKLTKDHMPEQLNSEATTS